MHWVTYQSSDGSAAGRGPRTGVVDGETIRALPSGTTLLDLLVDGELTAAGDTAMRAPAEVIALDEVTLLAPITHPPSVRDSLCFLQHMRNCRRVLGDPRELEPIWTQTPAFYFSNPANMLGPNEDVPIAPGSRWFDLELEVAAVVGRPGRDLDPASAEGHIAGYLMFCDWSARDLQQRENEFGLGLAKAKDCGTTLGPALVTPDELEPYRRGGRLAMELTAEVNGQRLTSGRLDEMDWTFSEVLAYASRGVDLRPGDVVGSGTVPGGCLLEHLDTTPDAYTRWLRPGDVVSLRGEGLGETRQRITAGSEPRRLSSGY